MVAITEQDVFKAGVRPGGPTTGDEVKILICYILSETGASMSFSQLHEALLEHELVNYFELVSAADSLESTGHITATLQNGAPALYAVTELGKKTAETIDGLLPKSVRDKSVESAKRLLSREKREREVKAEIFRCEGGFEVDLALPEDGGELLSFKVFCPTKEEASLVRRRFLNDPSYIYKGVLALLTGDKNIIGEMFPSNEELF